MSFVPISVGFPYQGFFLLLCSPAFVVPASSFLFFSLSARTAVSYRWRFFGQAGGVPRTEGSFQVSSAFSCSISFLSLSFFLLQNYFSVPANEIL
jgi:hypothetical protein